MSEVVEIRAGSAVSEVVEQLAREMGEETLCLSVGKSVAEGEWVRFNIQLEDGTHVIEGVGRSNGAVPRGNPTDRYELHLSELSFDERNEIMYERMLIAKDAAKGGDDTGVIKLSDAEMAELDSDEASDEVHESAPPKPSAPPPPPAASLKDAKSTKRTSKSPPAKAKADSPKKRTSSAPKTRASSAPKKRTSKSPPAKKRAAAKPSGDSDTKVDVEAPKTARRDDARPSRRPPAISDGPYGLEVPFDLVAQARRLEDRLPRKLLNRDRTPGQPEAAVLKTAIRVGLRALEALAEDE